MGVGAVTVSSRAAVTDLTTRATAKDLLGVTDDAQDARLDGIIKRASDAVMTYCGRSFAREAYSETLPGYGDLFLMLSRTPIVAVSTVTYGGTDTITDYVVDEPEAGMLYREKGWVWTAQTQWDLGAHIVPRSELPKFTVAYTAGYLLPGDDLVTDKVSASTADNSFNLSAGSFPLLAAGDVIKTAGFASTGSNNGIFTVVTRTAAKVTVSETVTTEAESAAALKTLTVRTLPGDIEQAALEAAKAWWYGRGRDPLVSSKSVGGLSVSYAGASAAQPAEGSGLPMAALAILAPWRRGDLG